tara:strand:+ start:66232 stop:67185 length:954 start_codon:yes stop_codon:yes gene_type:complete
MNLNNLLKLIFISLILYSSFIVVFGFFEFKESITSIPIKWWLLSILFPFLSHFILTLRWHYFIRYLNYPLNLIDSLKIYLAGLALISAPARSGEAIRSVWLSKRHNITTDVGIGITLSERIGDLISALILLFFSLGNYYIIIISIIFLFIFHYTSTNLDKLFIKSIKRTINRIPLINKYLKEPNKIKLITNTYEQLKNLNKIKPFIISIFLCSLAWLLESILLYVTFRFLNISLSFKEATLIRTAMGIGGVISLLPGGLLTSESTAVALSIGYGYGRIEALAGTLFIRIYTLFVPSLMGFIALMVQKDLVNPYLKSK